MPIDKELYRNAYRLYREWNEEELQWRVRNAGKLTPQAAWRKYVDLWEFCMKIAPPPSEQQLKKRAIEQKDYYDRMRKFESWRNRHGKTP
jgi:hypothetical protein